MLRGYQVKRTRIVEPLLPSYRKAFPELQEKSETPAAARPTSGYRFLEHMTDAEIEAFGNNLEEAFENAGRALEDTMVDIASIGSKVTDEITVEGSDKEALLYSWLEALILKQDTDGMLYSKFSCSISRKDDGTYGLTATVRGERFDRAKHEQKTAIKAPTYYEMRVEETVGHASVRFVLDL